MGLSTLISDLLAAKEQKKGIANSTAIQKEFGDKSLAIYNQMITEGKSEREAASLTRQLAIKQIEADVQRGPGTSKLFNVGLKRGTEALARQYSALGLVSGGGGSTAFGRATGDLTEGLLARDIEGIRAERRYLAGVGPAATSPETALGAFGLYGGAQTDLSNLALGKASVNAGIYRSIGQFGESVSNENYLKGIIANRLGGSGGSYNFSSKGGSSNAS